MASDLFNKLKQHLGSQLCDDLLVRRLYATDASPYQTLPLAVAWPRQSTDCRKILSFACANNIPIIPRGAGTSLAGQTIGEGIILDFSRHMNRILSIDPDTCTAIVEPGVTLDSLNDAARKHGLMFGPDPSTAYACKIAGMIGNNSWGVHTLAYGTTRDNVIELSIMLADGTELIFSPITQKELLQKLEEDSKEGKLYQSIYSLIGEHHDSILKSYPDSSSVQSNTGYALDGLANNQPWNTNGHTFNLASLLCGSEGTLALTLSAKIKLTPLPKQRKLLCAHFISQFDAVSAVGEILHSKPDAIELLDEWILTQAQHHSTYRSKTEWVQGKPKALLLIEFSGDDDHVLLDRINQLKQQLQNLGHGYAFSTLSGNDVTDAWGLRRAGLGLLMGLPGNKKAVSGIEDSAVPIDALPAYLQQIHALMNRHGLECVYYGPVSRGTVHLRPLLDLSQPSQQAIFEELLREVAMLAASHGGTISAKHGNGRLRTHLIEICLNREMVSLHKEIKQIFDPDNLLNPGNIVNGKTPLSDLRESSIPEVLPVKTGFNWQKETLLHASGRCNGAGVCLKDSGNIMCPTYQLTGLEQDTTRGRANILRQALSAHDPYLGLADPDLHMALDLCISCKGCKSDCPANVDMARLKSEALYQRNRHAGAPMRAKLVAHFPAVGRLASKIPGITNGLLASRLLKSLLGFHPDRQLPRYSNSTFSHQFSVRTPASNDRPLGQVVLFNDPIIEYLEPQIGMAAVSCLEHLGYEVTITPCLSFGRSAISQGMLDVAREQLMKSLKWLNDHVHPSAWIIGLEPSELLTLRDEAPELIQSDSWRITSNRFKQHSLLFEEFIVQHIDQYGTDSLGLSPQDNDIVLHVHCNQKVLSKTDTVINCLSALTKGAVHYMDVSCCGMAGSFGYEKEHFNISIRLGNKALSPLVHSTPDSSLIVATGFSCREQIATITSKKAMHTAELLCKQFIPHA